MSSNTAFFEATIQQVEASKLYFVSYLNYKSFEFPFPLYQVTRMCLRYGNANPGPSTADVSEGAPGCAPCENVRGGAQTRRGTASIAPHSIGYPPHTGTPPNPLARIERYLHTYLLSPVSLRVPLVQWQCPVSVWSCLLRHEVPRFHKLQLTQTPHFTRPRHTYLPYLPYLTESNWNFSSIGARLLLTSASEEGIIE